MKWSLWIVLAAGLAACIWFFSSGSGDDEAVIQGQAVRRGPLRIAIVERGNLQAADAVVLKNEVEGRTTILFLIEEGTIVEAGELVCELDTSELEERRVSQEITVQNREASHVKAKQNYAIQESENVSNIQRSERELRFAKLDLKKYIEGDYPQQLQEKDEAIILSREELQRATQDLEWSERLAEKGFLENTQLEADRLGKRRNEIQLNQNTRAIELLKDYEHPRRLDELEANVAEAGRELDRINLQAKARIVDYDAEVRTTEAQLNLEREKLARIDKQIENAKLYAPSAGMIVYWQEESRWGGGEPLQEGSEVRERQELITIPSAGSMIAQASLHESVIEQVEIGMPCLITVDAVPDDELRGQIRFKAVLPDQVSRWVNPDLRVYRSEVKLIDANDRLRPGMSCSIEIIVDEIEDALYIPLQSVFLDAGETVCFVSKGTGHEMRSIEVGKNDGKWVAIDSGLEEGEVVLLSQPAGSSLRTSSGNEGGEQSADWGTRGTEPTAERGAGKPKEMGKAAGGEWKGKAGGGMRGKSSGKKPGGGSGRPSQ